MMGLDRTPDRRGADDRLGEFERVTVSIGNGAQHAGCRRDDLVTDAVAGKEKDDRVHSFGSEVVLEFWRQRPKSACRSV